MVDPIAPSPAPDNSNLSGGGWIQQASGTYTSGSPELSGPYAYCTQSLTLRYSRKPRLSYNGSKYSTGMSLGQFSGVVPVNGTMLHVDIWTVNTCSKIEQPFTTSAYEQKQKFALNALSTDQYGQSYGSVSGFIFGPNGSITTTQPWIYIRPWDTTIDTEYVEITQGTSHGFAASTVDTNGCTTGFWKQSDIMEDFKYYPGPAYKEPDFNTDTPGWPPTFSEMHRESYGCDYFWIY